VYSILYIPSIKLFLKFIKLINIAYRELR